MISQEKAKALKEAGLLWEPKVGDWYICIECNGEKRTGYGVVTQLPHGQYQNHIELFAPRLDQILAEIEKLGYFPSIGPEGSNPEKYRYYVCILYEYDELFKEMAEICGDSRHTAATREDAASLALLYILRGETNESR